MKALLVAAAATLCMAGSAHAITPVLSNVTAVGDRFLFTYSLTLNQDEGVRSGDRPRRDATFRDVTLISNLGRGLGGTMRDYELYFLRDDRVLRVERIAAFDDDHALRLAREHPEAAAKEVWARGRLVGVA